MSEAVITGEGEMKKMGYRTVKHCVKKHSWKGEMIFGSLKYKRITTVDNNFWHERRL